MGPEIRETCCDRIVLTRCSGCPNSSVPKSFGGLKRKLSPILYTTEEGGGFHGIQAHSVFLPDGSVWGTTLGRFR